jgi:putative membrane protein
MFSLHSKHLACGALALALSTSGWAESGKTQPAAANPAFANPDTPGLLEGRPGEAANVADIVFLKQMAIANRAEIEMGRMAAEKDAREGVDRFGQHMVKDHGDAGDRVSALARSAKVELPKGLDAEHEATKRQLQALNGREFELRYVESQIKGHQKAAQLLIHEIGSGQHTAIRQFAADTLPRVMEHLDAAKALHGELTGAVPPSTPAAP